MAILVFFVSTICFVIIASYFTRKNAKVKKRVEKFISKDNRNVSSVDNLGNEKKKPLTWKSLIERIAKNFKASESKHRKLEEKLQTANIPLSVEEFITIKIVVMGSSFIITMFIGLSFIFALVVAFIGWQIPTLYVNQKRKKRLEASAKQLPQVLETMTNALKSGFSFMQAMNTVSKEISDPLGKEFQLTIKEINLGITMEDAFENMLNRLPNKDLEIMVTAVLVQRTTGGNLAQILDTIQDTISERIRLKDELKALTSQGRMSALVITLLPVFIGLALNLMNPEYFQPLFSHPLGYVLLGIGVTSGLLGWLFIKKIVTIEV
ncbi:type II secretion system F family protein [Caldibacillus lycopersici]|uniref:Type II secretion system F family protein n=1 Tax=Perspicuibacillus lycopersici TaxID=1325689 RepID=A0AAE3LN62_9BACI|nr:type II secretion system F family protein [Perspicuibacillus lycopersici]MCU9613527.1 type II secretion system F family protein [Perspicuibacillus lycopersici]